MLCLNSITSWSLTKDLEGMACEERWAQLGCPVWRPWGDLLALYSSLRRGSTEAGTEPHQGRFRLEVRKKKLPWEWSGTGTGFLARQLMPHGCQYSRGISITPSMTCSKFWLALKWPGSCTRWSLEVSSHWSIQGLDGGRYFDIHGRPLLISRCSA